MKLTSIQQALYDYIKRVHSEYSRVFVLDVQDLWEYLLASGFQLSKSDVVGVLQELQALDVGLRLLKSRVEGDIWAVHLKWVMSPAERTKHWRQEQAKLGRKARMLYLTNQENQQVLRKAHLDNDKAVLIAYGLKKQVSESDIVEHLMKLYCEKDAEVKKIEVIDVAVQKVLGKKAETVPDWMDDLRKQCLDGKITTDDLIVQGKARFKEAKKKAREAEKMATEAS